MCAKSHRFFLLTLASSLIVLIGGCLGSDLQQAIASPQSSQVYLPYVTRGAPGGAYWRPAPGTSWQIQYSGELDTSLPVMVYNLDLFDTPVEVMQELDSRGVRVICYFSAGSWEDWRPDADDFPPEILGNDLEGWPGEKWLDIRQLHLLAPIMTARLDLAVQKGCHGVDPDNVDGYTNDTGFPLTYADQLIFNRWLAEQAHTRQMAIGLKNDLGQIPDLLDDFDWALNEQCFQYNECDALEAFIQAGKPVFGIEYQGHPEEICPIANAMNFDVLFKRLELDAWRIACR